MRFIYLFFGSLLITACHTNSRQEETVKTPVQQDTILTAMGVDNRLASADSLVLVFYDNPFTADSLQYSRFYHQQSTTRTKDINTLLEQLRQPVQTAEKPMPCRNEGKIWMYSQGKIFQTVYFAYSKPGCRFMFFIKDGIFYFLEPDDTMLQLLREVRAALI